MFYIFGFYKFKKLSYLKRIKNILLQKLIQLNLRGTIIISKEGVNGSISEKNNIKKLKKI